VRWDKRNVHELRVRSSISNNARKRKRNSDRNERGGTKERERERQDATEQLEEYNDRIKGTENGFEHGVKGSKYDARRNDRQVKGTKKVKRCSGTRVFDSCQLMEPSQARPQRERERSMHAIQKKT